MTKNISSFDSLGQNNTRSNSVKKTRRSKNLKTANLSDDILFSLLMQREEFCKIVLSIVLNKDIVSVEYSSIQKTIALLPEYKSVRLDVFAKDSDGILYNVEMQKLHSDSMPKRARFYQSILDTESLRRGTKVKYESLPKTFIIFITEFDVFGKGLYKYTFENTCLESPELHLNDGTTKLFLNTNGYNQNGEPDLLIRFLHYVSESVPENADGDPLLEKLDETVRILKNNQKLEDDYMRTDWIEEEAERRGLEEGLAEGREKGLAEGRAEGEKSVLQQMIAAKRKLHFSEDAIKEELIDIYGLSVDDAIKLMQS